MKKFYAFLLIGLVGATLTYTFFQNSSDPDMNRYLSELNKQKSTAGMTMEEIKNLPKKDRPDLAYLHEFEITKDPVLGYPPVDRKLQAQQIVKEKLAAMSLMRSNAGSAEWVERGPTNVGGRTRALMFDPNDATNKKIWAGGVAGGIWYKNDMTNADEKWQNVNDFMANLAVSAIAYDPNNTNDFYVGTGEGFNNADAVRGTGVFKSTDGGTTWNHLESTNTWTYVNKIAVTSSSTILAATQSGLYRSMDGGDTWEKPTEVQTRMADLEIGPTGILYLGDFAGNVYMSADDGQSWSNISPGLGGNRVEIGTAASDSQTIYAMAASGGDVAWFAKTVDGGENWNELTSPKYLSQGSCGPSSQDFARGQAWYDLIIGVDPSDANKIIVGGVDLHQSLDGGDTWRPISYWTGSCDDYVHADQHSIIYRPGVEGEAIFGNDGGVFYSKDLNADDPDFVAVNNHYNVTQYYGMAMLNEIGSHHMLAGAQDNGSHRFSNQGLNETVEVTGGDGVYCFIDQNEPDIQITSYVYNNYYLSRNRGNSFPTSFGLTDDGDDTGSFINPGDYDSDANILYTRTKIGHIGRYTIQEFNVLSEEISVSYQGAVTNILVSPFEQNVIYLGTSAGHIYKVADANATPIPAQIFADGVGSVTSIDVSDNGQKILCTIGNYGLQSVWYSADAGATWKNLEGDLPDMPVWWGIFNPSNNDQAILATEVGVWSTQDVTASEVTWQPDNAGLGNVSCRMLQHRAADGLIGLATHGRGVFTTSSYSNVSFAQFDLEKDVYYVGETVNFINGSGNATSYLWQLEDGVTSDVESPTHSFDTPGPHKVTLTINGDETISKDVFVLPTRAVNFLTDLELQTFDTYAANISGTGFELGNSRVSGKNGTSSGENAWVTDILGANYENQSLAYLYLPEFDFSASGTYSLSFQTKYRFEAKWDGFIVEYSTDRGTTWNKLGSEVEEAWYNDSSVPNSIFGSGVPLFTGVQAEFAKKEKDVSFLSGISSVTFRILFQTDAGTTDVGMAIDDFAISGPDVDPIPDFVVASSDGVCHQPKVVFASASSGTITSYNWNFGAGATPATATGIGPHEVDYSTPGAKTIQLSVNNADGLPFVTTKTDYIIISEVQETAMSATSTGLCVGESVTITVDEASAIGEYELFDLAKQTVISDKKMATDGAVSFTLNDLSEDLQLSIKLTDPNSGCEFLFNESIEVNVDARPDVTLTDNNGTLSVPFGIATYQWYRNNEAIEDAIFSSYKPVGSGEYYVVATNGGCTVQSETVELSILSADLHSTPKFVYPNPTYGSLKFQRGQFDHASIHSISGQLLIEKQLNNMDDVLDVNKLENGIYLLVMTGKNGNHLTQKFRKL